jgi:hypothetical protein
MVEAGCFDLDEGLVWFQGSQFLNTDFNHLGTTGAESAGDASSGSYLYHEPIIQLPT